MNEACPLEPTAVSGDIPIGYVTDRDLVVRGLAAGLHPGTSVQQIMSEGLICCSEDDLVDAAAEKMAKHQVRRLPVLTKDGRLCGIISLGDIAARGAMELPRKHWQKSPSHRL